MMTMTTTPSIGDDSIDGDGVNQQQRQQQWQQGRQ